MKAFQRKEKANCQVHDKVMLKPEKTHIHMSNRSFPKRPKKRRALDEDPGVRENNLELFSFLALLCFMCFSNAYSSTKQPLSIKVKPENVQFKAFQRKPKLLSKLNLKMCTSTCFNKIKIKISIYVKLKPENGSFTCQTEASPSDPKKASPRRGSGGSGK